MAKAGELLETPTVEFPEGGDLIVRIRAEDPRQVKILGLRPLDIEFNEEYLRNVHPQAVEVFTAIGAQLAHQLDGKINGGEPCAGIRFTALAFGVVIQ